MHQGAVLDHLGAAATLCWIHSTLRAALNGAVRAGLIAANPARFPELPPAARLVAVTAFLSWRITSIW